MKNLFFIALIGSLFNLIGCSQSSQTESKQPSLTFNGALVVKGSWNSNAGEPCIIAGDINYILKTKEASLNKIIQRDLKVTIKNSKNEVIALGNLQDAIAIKAKDEASNWCSFPIKIENISTSDFYTVSVGKLEQSFTKADLLAGNSNIYSDSKGITSLITF